MPKTDISVGGASTVENEWKTTGAQIGKALAMGMSVTVEFDFREFYEKLFESLASFESLADRFMRKEGEMVEQDHLLIWGEAH